MARENYGNLLATTLSAAITSTSATSLSVVSSTGFPSSGQFTVRIDGEILLVTAISGTTWTITRGQEGSTAATHTVGTYVTMVLTDGSIRRLVRQSKAGTNVAARRETNYIEGESVALTLTDDSTNDKCDVQIDVKIPSTAGTPTGTPANGTFKYDSTNNKLYVYFGAWRGVTLT